MDVLTWILLHNVDLLQLHSSCCGLVSYMFSGHYNCFSHFLYLCLYFRSSLLFPLSTSTKVTTTERVTDKMRVTVRKRKQPGFSGQWNGIQKSLQIYPDRFLRRTLYIDMSVSKFEPLPEPLQAARLQTSLMMSLAVNNTLKYSLWCSSTDSRPGFKTCLRLKQADVFFFRSNFSVKTICS